ncbi:hypothetical protein GCM10010259_05900 [Streptomyces daghestanicus]|uniref:Uncharacterized protein n=1 Tax=Streptomyces daghestanicus TaxID=66885 RepID=A0ABQ3Q8T9_9ACTN|nr:hypothetical protein GCM10010259_05900 [Streptomyces daghestanicus]GHI33719.1 hypothetical protein Sdagh_54490 [Streptomyces daghestanicus]
MDVGRLPHVGGEAERGEAGEVLAGGADGVGVAQDAGEAVAPARGAGQLAHQAVAGRVEVAGDLEGEGAAGGEGVGPAGEQVVVAGDPLEGGVAEDEVVGLGGVPGADVGGGEVEVSAAGCGSGVGAGAFQHRGRVVVAGDAGGGPAVGEQDGGVAGAAAEVGDAGRVAGEAGDAGEEVGEGAGAGTGVAQVLGGVPGGGGGGHGSSRSGAGRGLLRGRVPRPAPKYLYIEIVTI